MRRVKGKQVKGLYEPVTVNAERMRGLKVWCFTQNGKIYLLKSVSDRKMLCGGSVTEGKHQSSVYININQPIRNLWEGGHTQ